MRRSAALEESPAWLAMLADAARRLRAGDALVAMQGTAAAAAAAFHGRKGNRGLDQMTKALEQQAQ